MKRFLAPILVALLVGAARPGTVAGQNAMASERAARAAAEDWLEMVDAGDYEASWNEAAELFRTAVTSDAWVRRITTVRTQVGKL